MVTLPLLLALSAPAAPRPWPKPPKPLIVSQQALAGRWVMWWGGTDYQILLEKNGCYACDFRGTRYVGSWGVDRGLFWLTEAVCTSTADPGAWKSYTVRMKPGTLEGQIEVGAPAVLFRLERRRPEKAERIGMPRSE